MGKYLRIVYPSDLGYTQGEGLPTMRTGSVQRLIALIYSSLEQLQVPMSLTGLEDVAALIYRAMTLPGRHFHTLDHVFSFSKSGEPIQTLAGLFHDVVYYQVDMGFLPEIMELIRPYILEQEHDFWLTREPYPQDRMFGIAREIFNYAPGQELSPYVGLNEFASALVMNKMLAGIVPERDLVRMTVCVEASIPFRGVDEHGWSHFDVLEGRLKAVNQKYDCGLSSAEIVKAIQNAVLFSNKDVENFSETNPGRFLDNTWNLLPETNTALRHRNMYTIREYRQALEKMGVFFQGLNYKNVFNQYGGVPADEEFSEMVSKARYNVSLAREYLMIKLVAQAVLEALAELTGGDAPLSLFLGEIADRGKRVKGIQHYLPVVPPESWVNHQPVILELLESGRASDSVFDLRNSPVSLYVYHVLSGSQICHLSELAEQMFKNTLSAQDFLNAIDGQAVSDIARACASMVFTRRDKLLKIADRSS